MLYALIGIWYGLEDAHEEIISIHETRESARKALIDMEDDINYENLIIRTVKKND